MAKTNRLLATLVILAILAVAGVGADVYRTYFALPPLEKRVLLLEGVVGGMRADLDDYAKRDKAKSALIDSLLPRDVYERYHQILKGRKLE